MMRRRESSKRGGKEGEGEDFGEGFQLKGKRKHELTGGKHHVKNFFF